MNTTRTTRTTRIARSTRIARNLVSTTLGALTATAAVLLQAMPSQAAAAGGEAQRVIVELPRVEIVVRRPVAQPLQVVQLPRVVVSARRAEAVPVQIVELPRVVITARRTDAPTPVLVASADKPV